MSAQQVIRPQPVTPKGMTLAEAHYHLTGQKAQEPRAR
jgi:hypothetical protein